MFIVFLGKYSTWVFETGFVVENLTKGKLEEKISHGRHRHRSEDNIKINLKESVYDCVDSVRVAVDKDQWQALLKMAINLWFNKSRRIS